MKELRHADFPVSSVVEMKDGTFTIARHNREGTYQLQRVGGGGQISMTLRELTMNALNVKKPQTADGIVGEEKKFPIGMRLNEGDSQQAETDDRHTLS